jgi:hypothetical protein
LRKSSSVTAKLAVMQNLHPAREPFDSMTTPTLVAARLFQAGTVTALSKFEGDQLPAIRASE